SLFRSRLLPPPRSTLFPYTTLFRSLEYWLSYVFEVRRTKNPDKFFRRMISCSGNNVVRIVVSSAAKRANGYQICTKLHSAFVIRSEEHTSELQSRENLVCRLLLEKK